MAHEHWNDVPSDIAGEEASDLPGGFGTDNPDLSPEATIDEIIENDAIGVDHTLFTNDFERGGITAGTPYAHAVDDGSTIDPNELARGEEAHPGAGVGFTGREMDKRVPPGPLPHEEQQGELELGGVQDESYTHQQQENMSVETEGPTGGQGAAGDVQPPKGKKAA